MTRSRLSRQSQRWLSILFIGTALAASFTAASGQELDNMVFYLPLLPFPPLFLVMEFGLYCSRYLSREVEPLLSNRFGGVRYGRKVPKAHTC